MRPRSSSIGALGWLPVATLSSVHCKKHTPVTTPPGTALCLVCAQLRAGELGRLHVTNSAAAPPVTTLTTCRAAILCFQTRHAVCSSKFPRRGGTRAPRGAPEASPRGDGCTGTTWHAHLPGTRHAPGVPAGRQQHTWKAAFPLKHMQRYGSSVRHRSTPVPGGRGHAASTLVSARMSQSRQTRGASNAGRFDSNAGLLQRWARRLP